VTRLPGTDILDPAMTAPVQDLVAMKQASGRPIDLADVEALEAIARKAEEP
jgi:hypothetical protein